MTNIEKILRKYGKDTVAKMVIALRQGGKGDSRFIKMMKSYVEKDEEGVFQLLIKMPSYGTFIDSGRGPNKRMPPAGSLLGWMKRKGIIEKKEFIIRKNVGIRGIKATPFLYIWYDRVLDINDQLLEATKKEIKEIVVNLKKELE